MDEEKAHEEEFLDRVRRRRQDWDYLLQSLVRGANNTEADRIVDVTLMVGGLMITGTLTSGRAYMAGIADELAASGGEDIAATFRGFSENYPRDAEETPGQETTKEQEEEYELMAPHYIHLRDAYVFDPAGNVVPANRGVWWRGRVEAVDGWCFGRFKQGEPPPEGAY